MQHFCRLVITAYIYWQSCHINIYQLAI